MKNPNYREPGISKAQGHREPGEPAHEINNKFPPGDPGITGQSDYDFDAIAPIRFKPGSYKSEISENPVPLT